MKPATSLKIVFGVLQFILGLTVCTTISTLYDLIMLLIKGRPLNFLWGLSVNLFRTNNPLVNYTQKIYIVDLSGSLLFFEPSLSVKLFSGIYPIIVWTCISYVIFLMTRIVKTTLHGSPFIMQNVKRLRIIGALIVLTPLVLHFSQYIFVSSLLHNVRIDNTSLSAYGLASMEIIDVIEGLGLLFLVLSLVFRIGIKIKEENELTV